MSEQEQICKQGEAPNTSHTVLYYSLFLIPTHTHTKKKIELHTDEYLVKYQIKYS